MASQVVEIGRKDPKAAVAGILEVLNLLSDKARDEAVASLPSSTSKQWPHLFGTTWKLTPSRLDNGQASKHKKRTCLFDDECTAWLTWSFIRCS
ncbi:hypothetical protein PsorP6_005144 [Peronosclerospora sorghi]|uniref:Uncharacterized protein n=1 Tax=Peronosclerospora sorghi TaxID=230839 RepID=A0ACC0W1Y1_9STRA|nr:hypothetical protein PsorP6_005144 [Peronosclerospora sorghi]